jgi:tRNA-dihydrouridine synthase A
MFRPMTRALDRRFSVAPMMDRTDRHARYLHRLLTPSTLLYTEMVTTGAILHGDAERHLRFDPAEHPVALQLGGSDPAQLAECARIGAEFGYDEINLNVGCPSDRVSAGRFGACLMAEPALVARGVAAMRAAVAVPVTVKCRIGIDGLPARSRSGFDSAEAGRDGFEHLCEFVRGVADAGVDALIVHARIAVLGGLSPKENRTIPPLRYDVVHRLKDAFPDLPMVINGGFADADTAVAQLARVDGVMIGRAAYDNPMLLAEIESRVFGGPRANREAVIAAYAAYAERADAPVRTLARPLMGLYAGMPGARAFRRALGEAASIDDLRFAAHSDRNLVLAA